MKKPLKEVIPEETFDDPDTFYPPGIGQIATLGIYNSARFLMAIMSCLIGVIAFSISSYNHATHDVRLNKAWREANMLKEKISAMKIEFSEFNALLDKEDELDKAEAQFTLDMKADVLESLERAELNLEFYGLYWETLRRSYDELEKTLEDTGKTIAQVELDVVPYRINKTLDIDPVRYEKISERIQEFQNKSIENRKIWKVLLNDNCETQRAWLGMPGSGYYNITLYGQKVPLYCDLKNNVGWTVLMNRNSDAVDFRQPFVEFENGFGVDEKNFWTGLQVWSALTNTKEYKLAVKLETHFNQSDIWAYENWRVRGQETGFGYSCRPSAMRCFASQPFSTEDNDQSQGGCTKIYRAAWWFDAYCFDHLLLTGQYINKNRVTHHSGITGAMAVNSIKWFAEPLKSVSMNFSLESPNPRPPFES